MLHATIEIPKIGQDGDAYSLAVAQFRNEIPGFQDFRAVNADPASRLVVVSSLLDDIERAAEDTFGQPLPFIGPATSTAPGMYAPHLDGRQQGAAVHVEQNDVSGTVYLAHPDEVLPYYAYWGHDFKTYDDSSSNYDGPTLAEMPDVVAGAVYEGPLVLDGITVFSQGNVGNLIPAIHQFLRKQAGDFLRVEAPGIHNPGRPAEKLSAEAIAIRALEFRGNLAHLLEIPAQ